MVSLSSHLAATLLQVVGFAVLISGTSVYNEILRAFLPPPPHRRRHHRRHHAQQGAGETAALEEGSLQEPLLQGGAGPSPKQQQQGGQQQQQQGGQQQQQRQGGVRFAPGTAAEPGGGDRGTNRPPLPARPRPIDRERYSMAR